jgi:hypothetical protein
MTSRGLASDRVFPVPLPKKCPGDVDAPRGMARGEWTATDAATIPPADWLTVPQARRQESPIDWRT